MDVLLIPSVTRTGPFCITVSGDGFERGKEGTDLGLNHADDEESRLGWRGWYGGGGGLVARDWSARASLNMCWIAARCSRGRDTADWRVV